MCFQFSETIPGGGVIYTCVATDKDAGDEGEIRYGIQGL